MFVVTQGVPASGSTWVFNVVRSLFLINHLPLYCLSADDELDARARIPVDAQNVLLKCHGMDPGLIKMAQDAGAIVITSVRDPRDSFVSQRERFKLSSQLIMVDLTRAFSALCSLREATDGLHLIYEDNFFNHLGTIIRIGDRLGLPVGTEQAGQILDSLTPGAIRARIDSRLATLSDGEQQAQDPLEYWHPHHIGDGLVGKHKTRVDRATRKMISGCLLPFTKLNEWRDEKIRWSPNLFHLSREETKADNIVLRWTEAGKNLVYGPYLHLPAGRWRARPLISSFKPTTVHADVYLPDSDQHPLAEADMSLRLGRRSNAGLDFDHVNHSQPIEVRLSSVSNKPGSVRFGGCDIKFLRPLD